MINMIKHAAYSSQNANSCHEIYLISVMVRCSALLSEHDDVMKWKHFLRYWPFVGGIHRPPVNSHHKGQWRGVLMFYLICAWINGRVNNRMAGDLRRDRAHYVMIDEWLNLFVMSSTKWPPLCLGISDINARRWSDVCFHTPIIQ